MLAEERSVVSACPYLAVALESGTTVAHPPTLATAWRPTTVVIGFASQPAAALPAPIQELLPLFDMIADTTLPAHVLDRALNNIGAQPMASAALVQLLRQGDTLSVEQALQMESLTYSTLQHGTEFEAWLSQQGPKDSALKIGLSANTIDTHNAKQPVVLCNRDDAQRLRVTLNRPAKHNAFSAAMRDELHTALLLAEADTSIEEVVLAGNGRSFCAGGDLDEFGLARDAAQAHLTRTTRSPALLIHSIRHRVSAQLHGACIGAGIEMTAFAAHVVATSEAFFALPEVGFGLVPGAGGTVSVPRRIGRHRAAALALSGQRIDAPTALAWGLIDAIA
ncbi:MAG: enoyl-CoA hydratase/isomerase family protein [Proteobacteria bacterium]|nr:enoyl-CoA hydratase/isomerase family protein [Pseudomonadota bacterium]